MYYPDKKKYIERSEKYNLIPVFKQFVVDTETPTTIFMKTGGSDRQMFLLESIEGSRRLARYSFIGVESSKIVKYSKKIFSVEKDGVAAVKLKTCFPLKELEKVMEGYYIYPDPELNHFTGGAVGYLGYDLVRYFEDIKIPGSTLGIPEMMLFLTDTIIVFDHLLHTVKIISTVRTDKHMSPDKAYRISTD
ncbi:MAG: anthranilate synthase component I, partial [Actinobacteria bacterium]|nr:anthranilate synthase component I [Actinomycetota bacterium]